MHSLTSMLLVGLSTLDQTPFPFDSSVIYNGPTSQLATITGSPFWPFSFDQVIGKMKEKGWVLKSDQPVKTPYGHYHRVLQFMTSNQRKVLWIPNYGWTLGQDDRIRYHQEGLFWGAVAGGSKGVGGRR